MSKKTNAERRALREWVIDPSRDGSGFWMAPRHLKHGTFSTYSNWGCQCQPCTDANTVKCLNWRHRQVEMQNIVNSKTID